MTISKKFLTSLAAGGMIAATLAATPAAAQRVEIGNAAAVVGEVEITTAQSSRSREISRRQRIAWGDLIETGRRSQLQILLLDRSTFGVGERASLRIDRFVYDPEEGRSMFATVIKGALRFFSGRQEGENTADLQTPAGRIGIRGTAIDLLVGEAAEEIAEDENFVGSVRSDDDEATLVILRGPGAATAGGLTPGAAEIEAAGVTVQLTQPGFAAYIPREGSPPIGPFRISDIGLARVQEQLAPEVARANRPESSGGNTAGILGALIGAAVIGAIVLSGDGDPDLPPITVDNGPDHNDDIAGTPDDYPDFPGNPDEGEGPNDNPNDAEQPPIF